MSAPGPSSLNPGSVIPNSVLSFLPSQAHNQGMMNENRQDLPNNTQDTKEANDQGVSNEQLVPAGVKALCDACSKLYPDQPNPLQVTTRLKYWLGGQDPLDYISMYWNPGNPELDVPPHWHYISFGISDLHGDGRVHPPVRGAPALKPPPSGFGFEVTLRAGGHSLRPPLWPAAILHSMARYVFATGNKLVAGDHISWHVPLDGINEGDRSRIRHLLVADDPGLPPIQTPHGTVSFLQLVGCTSRELKAAQRGSGHDVLAAIAKNKSTGGSWLVTDMSRRRSGVGRGTRTGPAHLAGVTAPVRWAGGELGRPSSPMSRSVSDQIKETLQRGLSSMSTSDSLQRSIGDNQGHMSTDSFEMSSIERALPDIPEIIQESSFSSANVKYYETVHLTFNPEAASLLPLAIDGRVSEGGHFTWRSGSVSGSGSGTSGAGVTVVADTVRGTHVSPDRPYAAMGGWLQVLIPPALSSLMSSQLAHLCALSETDSETDSDSERDGDTVTSLVLPLHFSWPEYGLEISVVHDYQMV